MPLVSIELPGIVGVHTTAPTRSSTRLAGGRRSPSARRWPRPPARPRRCFSPALLLGIAIDLVLSTFVLASVPGPAVTGNAGGAATVSVVGPPLVSPASMPPCVTSAIRDDRRRLAGYPRSGIEAGQIQHGSRRSACAENRPGASRIGAPHSEVTTTCRCLGPWTPSTRLSSMSLVAEGPLIQVSGLRGSICSRASPTVATTCVSRTTQM
jgi:hypothetical protein